MKQDCYEYVRQTYGVPAYIGVLVELRDGRKGVIVKANGSQQYIHVVLAGHKTPVPCHPTDGVIYHVVGVSPGVRAV